MLRWLGGLRDRMAEAREMEIQRIRHRRILEAAVFELDACPERHAEIFERACLEVPDLAEYARMVKPRFRVKAGRA